MIDRTDDPDFFDPDSDYRNQQFWKMQRERKYQYYEYLEDLKELDDLWSS